MNSSVARMTVCAMRDRCHRVAGAALGLVLLAACSGSPTAKSGGDTPPTVLTLILAEGREVPYADVVTHFADAVHENSGGSLVVDIQWRAAFREPTGEVQLIDRVRRGDGHLSQIPARAFDHAGIRSFVALQDPFTLDSLEAADAVAASALARAMLSDLEDEGLVGLGLYAENLRRPVGYRQAIRHARDYESRSIRSQPSLLSHGLLEALGAEPGVSFNYVSDAEGNVFDAAESTWASWEGQHPFPRGAWITGNVVYFPKFNVIVANPESFASLTEEQRAALRESARQAAEAWVAIYRIDEQTLAENWCVGGRRLVLATPTELASLRAAVAPLVAELEADPALEPDLAAVRELAAATDASPFELPRWCLPPTGDGARLDQ